MGSHQIHFVTPPDHIVKLADEVLRFRVRCANELRREIRAVAKATIDEADEWKRAIRDFQHNAAKPESETVVQLETRSPPEIIEKAKRLMSIQLQNRDQREAIQKVATSYVRIAEENQRLYDEFKDKYQGRLPPEKAE